MSSSLLYIPKEAFSNIGNEFKSIMSLNELIRNKEEMIDYESTINLADALFLKYSSERFLVENKQKDYYEVGINYVIRVYRQAKSFTQTCLYCDEQIEKLTSLSIREFYSKMNNDYGKILLKAEEYYEAGNAIKAINLYERALNLKPSDEDVAHRLQTIRDKLASL